MKTALRLLAAAAAVVATTAAADAQTIRVFANSAHQLAFQGRPAEPGSNLQDAFEKETGIKVVWEAVPYPQMRQTLMRVLASASAQYDVVMIEDSWAVPDILDKLVSVDAVATPAEIAALDGIFPAMRATFTAGGTLRGVPIRSNPQIAHYNREIFAERGIAVPKTFDEMLTAAEKASFTRADGARVFGLALKPGEDLITLVKALGGGVLTPDFAIGVDRPETIAALERVKTLFDKGAIPPNFFAMDSTSVQTLMRQGLAAMTLFGDNYSLRFNDPKGSQVAGKVGFFAVPGATAGSYAPAKAAYWGAALPKNGRDDGRKAAWTFVRYLASGPVQLRMALNGNGPVDAATLADRQFVETAPYAADSAAALANASPLLPVFDGTAQVQDTFVEAAVAAILGKKPVAEAMADARAKIEAIVAQKRAK
jgi:multiple sugar transport system substrate-binding protein